MAACASTSRGGEQSSRPLGRSAVFAVALDPDGKRAASGAADGTVKLWDVAGARLLVTLWSGDGRRLACDCPGGLCRRRGIDTRPGCVEGGGQAGADAKWLAPLKDGRATRPGRTWAEDQGAGVEVVANGGSGQSEVRGASLEVARQASAR